MAQAIRVLGVDACRAGWVAVELRLFEVHPEVPLNRMPDSSGTPVAHPAAGGRGRPGVDHVGREPHIEQFRMAPQCGHQALIRRRYQPIATPVSRLTTMTRAISSPIRSSAAGWLLDLGGRSQRAPGVEQRVGI
jgi:hypothetical protein